MAQDKRINELQAAGGGHERHDRGDRPGGNR